VSAIGKLGGCYSQNAKTLPAYYEALAEARFPVERGLTLDADDRLRRDAIMALMCQGRLEFGPIERAHGVRLRERFADEFDRLQPFVDEGLVEIDHGAVQVTPLGWYLVRAIAMVFDRYLRSAVPRERFSRVG
jgi:oxygen-independent coproporphyrinogen-3 oxidase